MIKKLTRSDDLTRVAQIIYQTDHFLFPFLFGKKERAIIHLSQLVGLEHNSFSYHHIHVYLNQSISGIMIEINSFDHLKETHDFGKVFSTSQLIVLAVKQMFLFPILRHNIKDGRYIQNICVDENARGQGIGTALLLDAFERAKNEGINKMYLDVEINNQKAIALYEKNGFVKIKKKRIWFLFPATYWMEKTL